MQPMAITASPGRMTVHEWAAMPDDERGELCDGVLVEEEVADLTHETAVAWFLVALRTWVLALGGSAYASEVKYALSNLRGRKPDVSVFFPGHPALPRRGAVTIPPDIAIEIVSPAAADQRRDRIAKLADYAAFGVRFYWLLDPTARTSSAPARASSCRSQAAPGSRSISTSCGARSTSWRRRIPRRRSVAV
jgi:Uma2 family endonuclease